MTTDRYVTLGEAARRLGAHRKTVWLWVKQGKLPTEKVGREVLIRKEDLSQTVKSNRGRKRKE